MRFRIGVGLVIFAFAAGIGCGSARAQSATVPEKAADPAYAPLWLYNGTWLSETAKGKDISRMQISNHCERTGKFFVCEQVIDGKSQDLVVFLPTGASGNTQSYRTQGLAVTAETPGDWGKLEITGDHWVYSSDDTGKAGTEHWRTINDFSGPDKIHFEIQRSADGKTWETQRSGDEHRVRK
ncbi:MAG: hypothetical protein ACREDR_47255 [Blastocatellia bacterium]